MAEQTERPSRNATLALLEQCQSIAECARKTGWSESVIRKWKKAGPEDESAPQPPVKVKRQSVPAGDLSPDRRKVLLGIVTNLDAGLQAFAEAYAADPVGMSDRAARTARDAAAVRKNLVETHPDLMAIANEGESRVTDEHEAARLTEKYGPALGLGDHDGQGDR